MLRALSRILLFVILAAALEPATPLAKPATGSQTAQGAVSFQLAAGSAFELALDWSRERRSDSPVSSERIKSRYSVEILEASRSGYAARVIHSAVEIHKSGNRSATSSRIIARLFLDYPLIVDLDRQGRPVRVHDLPDVACGVYQQWLDTDASGRRTRNQDIEFYLQSLLEMDDASAAQKLCGVLELWSAHHNDPIQPADIRVRDTTMPTGFATTPLPFTYSTTMRLDGESRIIETVGEPTTAGAAMISEEYLASLGKNLDDPVYTTQKFRLSPPSIRMNDRYSIDVASAVARDVVSERVTRILDFEETVRTTIRLISP